MDGRAELMTAEDRNSLSAQATTAMATIEELIRAYAARAKAPLRFAIGVYDGSVGGADGASPSAVAERTIAEFKIGEDEWGERNYLDTARRKVGVALRTTRNTGDLARGAPELFQEGEPKFPGAVLGSVNEKPIVVGASGLRGPEDEAFAQLLLELMKRQTA
jgi:hypothetical protein